MWIQSVLIALRSVSIYRVFFFWYLDDRFHTLACSNLFMSTTTWWWKSLFFWKHTEFSKFLLSQKPALLSALLLCVFFLWAVSSQGCKQELSHIPRQLVHRGCPEPCRAKAGGHSCALSQQATLRMPSRSNGAEGRGLLMLGNGWALHGQDLDGFSYCRMFSPSSEGRRIGNVSISESLGLSLGYTLVPASS